MIGLIFKRVLGHHTGIADRRAGDFCGSAHVAR